MYASGYLKPKSVSETMQLMKVALGDEKADLAIVNATIVNQASYEQDYPLIELRFENIRGEVIAARRFLPREYLGIPEQQISKMEPNDPVSINIEILDPGNDMISYEFNFL